MLGPDALLCLCLPTPRCFPSKRMLTCVTCPCSVSVAGRGPAPANRPVRPCLATFVVRYCCFHATESPGLRPSPVVQPDSGAGPGCVVPAGGPQSPHAATECVACAHVEWVRWCASAFLEPLTPARSHPRPHPLHSPCPSLLSVDAWILEARALLFTGKVGEAPALPKEVRKLGGWAHCSLSTHRFATGLFPLGVVYMLRGRRSPQSCTPPPFFCCVRQMEALPQEQDELALQVLHDAGYSVVAARLAVTSWLGAGKGTPL
jgi:hypothetical protein